ncbi:DDE superfamily endonuclease domain [Trinorchestia longiramus]|nr:DDE superfamily endonuclease domain [Trinorchestia longiramus]
MIRKKALNIYSKYNGGNEGEPQPGPPTASDAEEFQASKGWFDRFVKCYQLRIGKSHGEATSADTEAAEKYPEAFKQLIKEKGFKPKQQIPGLSTRKIKTLPIFWIHNSKAWITKALTSDWFHQCFVPQGEEYLRKKGMEFHVLLLMDNAGGHPVDSYHGVQIKFLPPNTTSLLQPLDQRVIRAFKPLYTRIYLQQLVDAIDEEDDFQLKVYWRNFTIASCLTVIHKALQDMEKGTLNACSKKLWPECVHECKGF